MELGSRKVFRRIHVLFEAVDYVSKNKKKMWFSDYSRRFSAEKPHFSHKASLSLYEQRNYGEFLGPKLTFDVKRVLICKFFIKNLPDS